MWPLRAHVKEAFYPGFWASPSKIEGSGFLPWKLHAQTSWGSLPSSATPPAPYGDTGQPF